MTFSYRIYSIVFLLVFLLWGNTFTYAYHNSHTINTPGSIFSSPSHTPLANKYRNTTQLPWYYATEYSAFTHLDPSPSELSYIYHLQDLIVDYILKSPTYRARHEKLDKIQLLFDQAESNIQDERKIRLLHMITNYAREVLRDMDINCKRKSKLFLADYDMKKVGPLRGYGSIRDFWTYYIMLEDLHPEINSITIDRKDMLKSDVITNHDVFYPNPDDIPLLKYGIGESYDNLRQGYNYYIVTLYDKQGYELCSPQLTLRVVSNSNGTH